MGGAGGFIPPGHSLLKFRQFPGFLGNQNTHWHVCPSTYRPPPPNPRLKSMSTSSCALTAASPEGGRAKHGNTVGYRLLV